MKSSYANFRDPIGLLKRMLLSKDRAARSALYRAASTVLLQPLDVGLEIIERRSLQKTAAATAALPVIFIVGAPRSGTTLLYQTLARFLPVTYFTNFSALFPRAPITASRWLARFLEAKNFDDHSFYGNVAGLAAPNDGFHIWNRWLGEDRYRAPQQISDKAKHEMKVFINAWQAAFEKPFINKNNRNTDCVALLAAIFDQAYFIIVQRHPVFVAQSLLLARLRIQGSKKIGWGLHGDDSAPGKSYVDEICEQVFSIETKLRADKQYLAPKRIMEVSYERFCHDPCGYVQRLSQEFFKREINEAALRRKLQPFSVTNEVHVERKEFELIRTRIGELYGDKILSQFDDHSSASREALSSALLV